MSIITEALRKAQKDSAVLRPPAGSHRKRHISKFFLILFAILISVVVVIRLSLREPSPDRQVPVAKAVPTVIASPDEVGAKQSPSAPRNDKRIKFEAPTLNGIMYAKNKPLAVINNIMMEEGEEIGDIKVVKIRPASVDVERNGRILTLHLKR